MKTNLLTRIFAAPILAGALALGACAGSNVSYQSRLTGMSGSRIEELKNLKDYHLSSEERCELAEKNNWPHQGELHLAATTIGHSLELEKETVIPCYIQRVMPGKQETEIVFFVKKSDGTRIVYDFDKTDDRVNYIDIQTPGSDGKSFHSAYPENRKIMEKGREKIRGYLNRIDEFRNQRAKAEEQKKDEVFKVLER